MTRPSAPLMLSVKTETLLVAMSRARTRSSPVLAMKSVFSSLVKARPLAPNGGKPAGARSGAGGTVVTEHGVGELGALLVLKMAPWNESETKRSPFFLKASALGAGKLLLPKMIVSELPSGLPSVRGPGAPIGGIVTTSSTGVDAVKSARIRWILDAPKLQM